MLFPAFSLTWGILSLACATSVICVYYLHQLWNLRKGTIPSATLNYKSMHVLLEKPHVTIIVPARNEQHNIQRCVESLLRQRYPNFDIIVINDNSVDDTLDILEEMKRTIGGDKLAAVDGKPLPPEWVGKPFAMSQGADLAHGDWLLFTDADTYHAPDALEWAMNQALLQQADIVSLHSRQEFLDKANHIIAPIVGMGIATKYPPRLVSDPSHPLGIANGQYILIRQKTFDSIFDVYASSLQRSLVEDRDIATYAKEQGWKVLWVDGRSYVSVRMYRSLEEAWHGWSKSVYAGAQGGLLIFMMLALVLPFTTVLPYMLLLAGLFFHNMILIITSLLQVVCIFVYRWKLDREIEHSRLWGFTHPIGGVILSALVWNAAWRQFTNKGVLWKGRLYQKL
jgi:chlorobactene glucosyltransferase